MKHVETKSRPAQRKWSWSPAMWLERVSKEVREWGREGRGEGGERREGERDGGEGRGREERWEKVKTHSVGAAIF
jgi:hypothetical protein